MAVFADATWHVTDSLDLIAGARYTQDDVLNERTSFGIAPTCNCGPPDPAFFRASSTSTSAHQRRDIVRRRSPRAGIRFAWSDTASVYATVSKGYKAGGTSTGNDTE